MRGRWTNSPWRRRSKMSIFTRACVQHFRPSIAPFLVISMTAFTAACDEVPSSRVNEWGSLESLSDEQFSFVCRAIIATLMGRELEIISVDDVQNGVAGRIVYLSYIRPNDGTLWKNRCMLEGGRVIWSTVDAFGPNTGFGRWRNDPVDPILTFTQSGSEVEILESYSDGSQTKRIFLFEEDQ